MNRLFRDSFSRPLPHNNIAQVKFYLKIFTRRILATEFQAFIYQYNK